MTKTVHSVKLQAYASVDLDRLSYSNGDVVYDDTNNTLRLMDGISQGGIKVATQAWTSALVSSFVSNSTLTTTLNSYATTASVSGGYVSNSNLTTTLTGYVTTSDLTTTLTGYVTTSNLTTTLGSYVTTSNLTTTLNSYATTSNLTTTLGSYVTSSSLTTTLSGYIQSNAFSVAPTNFADQVANRILAGPSSGPAGGVTFRALVAADIPALSYASPASVTLKANIASPTFTGTITAPTAIIGGVNIKAFAIVMGAALG